MAEVDQQRPWLGLDSFSEHTRGFFRGRDEEVGELARRVQRKLLTVLFGQSGLGKTSVLRAGIVPRLRGEGYCPVYVRIDYGPEAPLPALQVRRAIEAVARYDGEALPAGESLWALLHQRSGSFVDADGKAVMPLLIFDQFEEIFTLAQGDGGARARAAQFVNELACLVENRAPRELEERMDSDDALVERYDFAREDYRVLISLREDYLAHLEGLKAAMPSITQNRMRLAPMTGTQALQAVRVPGGALVTQEVAEAIVRFVAGGAEIGNAHIEPSLLSLICRELNDTRIAAGRSAITLDLLEGSHASILSDFYERAMADHPSAVRAIIEDVLLTDSGYRENVAQERVEQLLAQAGAGQGALHDLVNRRLLRIEERLDLRRVELTHDVLCSVVRASRDLRQEREARIENERKLEEQKASEIATRKSLVRTRQVAIGSAALAVVAVVAFGFAWHASGDAARAEKTAETTRRSAAIARDQAEQLIGYLNDDFAQQLNYDARQDIVENLNKKTLDYYLSLPSIAPDSDTERNHAMAMVRYGVALRYTARLTDSKKYLSQAVKIFEARRARGDLGQATAVALANAYLGLRRLAWADENYETAQAAASAGAGVLQPWASRAEATTAVRLLYAEILGSKGAAESYLDINDAIKSFDESQAVYDALGVHNEAALAGLATNAAASLYLRHAAGLPNVDAFADVSEKMVADLIEKNPNYIEARRGMAYLLVERGRIALDRHDMAAAIANTLRGNEYVYSALKIDPVNQNLRVSYLAGFSKTLAEYYLRAGQTGKAVSTWQRAIEESGQVGEDVGLLALQATMRASIAHVQAEHGEAAASATLSSSLAMLDEFKREHPEKTARVGDATCEFDIKRAMVARLRADLKGAMEVLSVRKSMLVSSSNSGKARDWAVCQDSVDEELAQVHLAAGRYAEAEALLSRFAAPPARTGEPHAQLLRARRLILLGLANDRLGNQAATAKFMPTLVVDHRRAVGLRGGDRTLEVELAAMLVLQARALPEHGRVDLAKARALLAALPTQMKQMHTVRKWHDMVEESIRKAGKA